MSVEPLEIMAKISKCSCPNCGVHVEFDASDLAPKEVRKGPCPSCSGDMWFFENNSDCETGTGDGISQTTVGSNPKRELFPSLKKAVANINQLRKAIVERARRQVPPTKPTQSAEPLPAPLTSTFDQGRLFLWWPASVLGSSLLGVFIAFTGLILYRSIVLLAVYVHGGSFPDPIDFLKLLLAGFLMVVVYSAAIIIRNINVVAPYKRKLAKLHPDVEYESVTIRDWVSGNLRLALKTCAVFLLITAICCFRDGQTLTAAHAQIAVVQGNIDQLKEEVRVYQQRVSDRIDAAQEYNEKLKREAGNQAMTAEAYNGNSSGRDASSPRFLSNPTEANSAAQNAVALRSYSDGLQNGIDRAKADARQVSEEANSKINAALKDNADQFLKYRSYQIATITELLLVLCLAYACIRLWKSAQRANRLTNGTQA